MKQSLLPFYLFTLLLLAACSPHPENAVQSDQLPPIYPDYTDVTIPTNIAPLNFLVRGDDVEAVYVEAGTLTVGARGNELCFSEGDWRQLLADAAGRDISVTVSVRRQGRWTQYKTFKWTVVKDEIDPWLTYRLIEPDYEVWNNIQLKQRCTENFDEAVLTDFNLQQNRCMNCHTFGNQDPNRSMLYVRGEGGGAILNENGHLRKLGLKTDEMVSGSVYFGFSPTGRYIVFSTNVIIPAFHSEAKRRLEVFDTKSDVYVADLEQNRIVRSPLTADSLVLETFPTFSPDGRYIYYCAAPLVQLPQDIKQLQYALVRLPFDEQSGTLGTTADTLISNAQLSQLDPRLAARPHSVCHPRVSPDGRYLTFTVQDYGTFPIWHRESDLWTLDLKTGHIDTMAVVNSNRSDTYHAWSSNGRWLVFASKRDDGLYGKPYFAYIDRHGRWHKPFCLPQRSPSFYDENLKSFNAPELGRGRVPFDAVDVQRVMQREAEKFQ
ncbi:MAG: PD40 domain-containing protein [Prevotella sp.]|nr:PD40 domain-containing protein [Prevotella sp.]